MKVNWQPWMEWMDPQTEEPMPGTPPDAVLAIEAYHKQRLEFKNNWEPFEEETLNQEK